MVYKCLIKSVKLYPQDVVEAKMLIKASIFTFYLLPAFVTLAHSLQNLAQRHSFRTRHQYIQQPPIHLLLQK